MVSLPAPRPAVSARPAAGPSLPVSTIWPVRVLIETARGRHTSRTVAVERAAGEPEAVTRQRAANAFRSQFGYADRIVSIDLYGA